MGRDHTVLYCWKCRDHTERRPAHLRGREQPAPRPCWKPVHTPTACTIAPPSFDTAMQVLTAMVALVAIPLAAQSLSLIHI